MKKYFFIAAALLLLSAGAKAQVTIGSADNPHSFSILELVGGGTRGLRLPQMTTAERDGLQLGDLTGDVAAKAQGLEIFNTDTKCVETWNGSKWIESCALPEEQILLTINTTDGTYIIPTSGYVGGTFYHAYDWNVSVDGGAAVRKTRDASTEDHDGIELTFQEAGQYQIRITPYNNPDDPAPGWGNAFGHGADDSGYANYTINKQKLILIDAPLTTKAFAPKISENPTGTNASYMFAFMFLDCINLTTPCEIVDTYKLPATITNLSHFLQGIHGGDNPNTYLISPIDLSGLEGWFNGNTSITDLSYFLYGAHLSNTNLETPIDLSPLQGWFSNNQKIENLSEFLGSTHQGNYELKAPINLSPLSGWFSANNNILNMSNFLSRTHSSNTSLISPISLSPLSGWFNGNTSITNLSFFLSLTHYGNTSLTSPIDLTPLRNWFNDNTDIENLFCFLRETHSDNPSLNLTGQKIFPKWIQSLKQGLTEIENVSSTFYEMFSCRSTKTIVDTAEPKFEDGDPLSSLGTPSNYKYTYDNRTTSFTPPTGW
ncbi:MAG: hypothetical protein LBS54_09220 [Dysgonamonadaceae bacterium]|jgi:hypothetical protein|nr:hypothetical protein [Dysgonamonadaceae bacterium]